jgi:hypothetical protein
MSGACEQRGNYNEDNDGNNDPTPPPTIVAL